MGAHALDCRVFARLVEPYIDSELTPLMHQAVATHLGDCSDCAAEAAQLRRLQAALIAWPVVGPAELADLDAARHRLLAAARVAGTVPARPRRTGWPQMADKAWAGVQHAASKAWVGAPHMVGKVWQLARRADADGRGLTLDTPAQAPLTVRLLRRWLRRGLAGSSPNLPAVSAKGPQGVVDKARSYANGSSWLVQGATRAWAWLSWEVVNLG